MSPPRGRPPLAVESFPPERLSPANIDDVWAFFRRFVVRPRDAFERKLLATDEVTLARDGEGGTVRAFVGLKAFDATWEGTTFRALCSL